MLKWAVNGHRQTHLQNDNKKPDLLITAVSPSEQQRTHLKRKSSDLGVLRRKTSWQNKENQFTSTPLHASAKSFCESPSRKMESFKDLSNIAPECSYNTSPKQSCHQNYYSNILKTPERMPGSKNLPKNYATTLPTFDVEYSPCALIPGPLLALRGVGIPDSYFEKPRYITPHSKASEQVNHVIPETKPNTKPNISPLKYMGVYIEESTLSSTKMGDATLERMIDAILESNHKERKPSKSQKTAQQQANMSPTYTPAEDPASDLQEVWDSEKARYRQKEQKFRARLTKKSLFSEREICSPQLQKTLDAGQLKRQRGVRKKRKITHITASVMNSAQKLLSKNLQVQKPIAHYRDSGKKLKIEHEEILPQKLVRNLSPDSGHNSSSDYEEDKNHSTLECSTTTDDNKTLDITKRRLSFSMQNLN